MVRSFLKGLVIVVLLIVLGVATAVGVSLMEHKPGDCVHADDLYGRLFCEEEVK